MTIKSFICIALVSGLATSSAGAQVNPGDGADPALLAAPYRAPYIPASGSAVLQQVPSLSDPTVKAMSTLRAKLDADPTNILLADELARRYIDFGREVGDAHYAGYAEAVIAPWMSRKPAPVRAMLLEATILQFRHQFAPARELLQAALAREHDNPQAWLTLATLDMVQGDYPTATQDCSQVNRTAGRIYGIACGGNLRSYTGQAQQSVALLNQIGDDIPSLSKPVKGWIQGLLAESCERLGNWADAEAHYQKALSYLPSDNFLQVAYADFLLDRGRPAEVLPLLAESAQSDTAFLRIALAQSQLKSPDVARYTWIMAARFEALTQRGSDYFGREQVRFALYLQHDPATALDLALRNWQVQRAPWDIRVALEAALAADKPEAAAPILAFVAQTKLQDPIIQGLAAQLHERSKPPTAGKS